jgi:hypothetical protein
VSKNISTREEESNERERERELCLKVFGPVRKKVTRERELCLKVFGPVRKEVMTERETENCKMNGLINRSTPAFVKVIQSRRKTRAHHITLMENKSIA